ncbi:hypothetical protein P2W50_31115 [Pseudomonas protegens]|uniref:hypothetical protein n=1 Tax=Pseudomonas protegens TaxID=380021 RepID=UPI0023ECD5B6|nr:hypothetical protein [Pseudomonas protegens]MDF4211103.1 hypothetical protein [Pseudomonas protegens]
MARSKYGNATLLHLFLFKKGRTSMGPAENFVLALDDSLAVYESRPGTVDYESMAVEVLRRADLDGSGRIDEMLAGKTLDQLKPGDEVDGGYRESAVYAGKHLVSLTTKTLTVFRDAEGWGVRTTPPRLIDGIDSDTRFNTAIEAVRAAFNHDENVIYQAN